MEEELFNPFSLKNKTILVTGASSGIGKGIALACAKMGANVIINGRNDARLQATLEEMAQGQHSIIVGDLTKMQDVKDVVSKCPALDGVVHCAGIGQRKLCKQLVEEDVDIMMLTNFKAPIMLQTELLKQKKIKKSASIVFVASIASESPTIGNAMYSASKGALKAYAKCLSVELASRLVRVNCISPAMVWTDLILKGGLTEEDLREDEKKYPLKRYGKPEDIANLAIYLLSDAASWMSNSDVRITGGGS